MQVAVAGVAERGEGDAVLLAEGLHDLDEVGDAGGRDDEVLVDLVARDEAEGLGDVPADAPDAFARRVVVGDVDLLGAGGEALFADRFVFALDLCLVRADRP